MLVLETSDTRLSKMKHQYSFWHLYTVQLVYVIRNLYVSLERLHVRYVFVYNLCASSLSTYRQTVLIRPE